MSWEGLAWVVVVGLVLVCWILRSVVEQLRSLDYKVEYWGKYFSGVAEGIRADLTEMQADTSSLSYDVADISKRTKERFPTEKEYEHARRDAP